MKRLSPKLLYFLIISFISCKEFIEPTIANRAVQLNAPANNYQSTNYTVNFWWEEVEDALSYRLQIVTPTFDSAASLVMDTVVSNNKFAVTLEPGEYEWRLRAENGSSETNYAASRSFTLLPGTLEEQTVSIISPANNLLTKQNTVTLKWKSLYGATKYIVQVDSVDFSGVMVSEQTVPATETSFTFPNDGKYYWRVQALNDDASHKSKFSSASLMEYDHTPPGTVQLKAPLDEALVSLPVTLKWNAVATAKQYKVYVYQEDGITLYNSEYPQIVNSTSLSFNSGNTGDTIYWRVSAIDAAQNEGSLSSMWSFVLQQ